MCSTTGGVGVEIKHVSKVWDRVHRTGVGGGTKVWDCVYTDQGGGVGASKLRSAVHKA